MDDCEEVISKQTASRRFCIRRCHDRITVPVDKGMDARTVGFSGMRMRQNFTKAAHVQRACVAYVDVRPQHRVEINVALGPGPGAFR